MPDNRRIVYVRNEGRPTTRSTSSDVDTRTSTLVARGPKMNHDVNLLVERRDRVRAQVDQWDQVYLAKLKD